MERKVVKFRRLKNGPPTKLPVLLDQPARAMTARKFALLVVLMASLSFGAATAVASGAVGVDDVVRLVPRELWDPRCQIKGNISVSTGERIFHTPNQLDYSATRIDYLKGERWFCEEADAVAAGWRKAGR